MKVYISEEKIKERVKELALEIEKDYKDKDINLICVLKGSLIFTSDLVREIHGNVSIDFLRVSSYIKDKSSDISLVPGLLPNIYNKDIIIVEDIIDTGKTINFLIEYLKKQKPRSIKVCTLLDKKERRIIDFKADYVGFDIEDKFVVGYGMDYEEKYRNLPYIGYM